MKTFADSMMAFNRSLDFNGVLPEGIRVMNPFKENKSALAISAAFYKKYYSDNNKRHIILGINPGRFGAGLTGIPFTDPKRLIEKCGLSYDGAPAHEPSSVFMYKMIDAYGGAENFYREFYINSICPLGFTKETDLGKEVNYNFYDSRALTAAAQDFIVKSIEKQLAFGIYTDTCFCLGRGKNEKILLRLNETHGFFKKIVALEHPRFIMQYKSKTMQLYIDKYIAAFQLPGLG
ncbi:MAG TPA: uracil-DNA glycosylase family protein [Agriterribacter sp.]|nr:uracil-DNA glycosylase family protein [Agriterribacter sp.]